MITFAGGEIDLDTFNHENMHQWWGDNVTESNYNMTFFEEGLATLGEYLFAARTAASHSDRAAFEKSLVDQFNANYARTGSFWRNAPSNPTAFNLFSSSSTYERPGTTYLALREILGHKRFTLALQVLQPMVRHRVPDQQRCDETADHRTGAVRRRLLQPARRLLLINGVIPPRPTHRCVAIQPAVHEPRCGSAPCGVRKGALVFLAQAYFS